MGYFEILIIAGLILINGFFVAAEFALVKVRTSQIDQLAEQGNWAAKLTSKALDQLDFYLSASQIGITVASLALGRAIAATGSSPMVESAFAAARASCRRRPIVDLRRLDPDRCRSPSLSLVTFLHMALGEQAPKSLAIRAPKILALLTAPPLVILSYVFSPVIWLLNKASNLTLWVLGLGQTEHAELAHTRRRAAAHRRRERGRRPPLAQRADHDRERAQPRGEDRPAGDGPPARHRLSEPVAARSRTTSGSPARRATPASRSARTT